MTDVAVLNDEAVQPRFVQLQNPRTKQWIKIDRKKGVLVGKKHSPYKNVHRVGCYDD